MNIIELHDWNLSPKEAIDLQTRLARNLFDNIPLALDRVANIAGVDVSVKDGISQAAVVVASVPELQIIEVIRTKQATAYPYIPGLLTFREGPVLIEAFRQLKTIPDVFLFDGMGQIHPRRMGIAAHMGLWLDKPTIGCGKTHFIGSYQQPDLTKGSYTELYYKGKRLGVVLRTRNNVKPVYISAGHKIDLNSAITITLAVTPKYRLPEPIRMAHKIAGDF